MSNSDQDIELTREELYQRVWSTPMQKLAAEFGLSDVGLAKVCKKYKIPKPARGYWAKLEHGKRVHRHPLSKINDESLQKIRLRRLAEPVDRTIKSKDAAIDPKIAALIELESDPAYQIVPSTSLRGAHPLVTATRDILADCKPTEYGRLWRSSDRTGSIFDLQVSKASLRRALLIVDTLLKAFQKRGYECLPGEGNKEPTVEILGRSFTIAIWESSKRYTRPEPKQNGRHDMEYLRWRFDRYEYRPTGMLELKLYPCGNLKDTNSKPLETRLQGLMVRILKDIDEWQVKAEKARIEAEKKEARKLAAIEKEIDRRQDSVRVANLDQAIPKWEQAERVRGYIEAVRAEASRRHGTVDEASEVGRWLGWAARYLAAIDPLARHRSLPTYSLTDQEIEALRKQCEAEWSDYLEVFRSSKY